MVEQQPEVAPEAQVVYQRNMRASEIMGLIRREPREVILEIGDMLDELRGDLVDEKLAEAVHAGAFDEMAARALDEAAAGKTVPLHEVLHQC